MTGETATREEISIFFHALWVSQHNLGKMSPEVKQFFRPLGNEVPGGQGHQK